MPIRLSPFYRAVLLLCALALPLCAMAKGPEKKVVLALADLGLQTMGGRPQTAGNTIATVHFAGEHHLLVTFPVRKLMKRLPDSQPGDDDRTIEAVLVDLPSGKVAARTNWRVHDAGQYLWDLGQGHFMLRLRSRLVTIEPVAHVSRPEPFEEHRLLNFEDRIIGIIVSAESDLLTVETTDRPQDDGVHVQPRLSTPQVVISFFRLIHEAEGPMASHAGSVRSSIPLALPVTADGYLDIKEESKMRWLFDYLPHEGKKIELSPYDTTCFPRALFVSRSEFIAFGCRGSVDKVEIGGFNMKGEEMWEQGFTDNFAFPSFSFAPTAGRFAMGRALSVISTSSLGPDQDPVGDQLTGEDIQVYQMSTGHPVFHTVVTPVQRTGQNFSLSGDGLQFAVIRDTQIEVYQLPALSGHDKQDVKASREFALEHSTGLIRLPTRQRVATVVAETKTSVSPAESAEQGSETQATPKLAEKPKANENYVYEGDVPAADGRKAPSLYQPGESNKPQ